MNKKKLSIIFMLLATAILAYTIIDLIILGSRWGWSDDFWFVYFSMQDARGTRFIIDLIIRLFATVSFSVISIFLWTHRVEEKVSSSLS